MASCYRVIKAVCIVLNLIMYTLLLVMNYAANNRSGILFGNSSIREMTRKYSIEFSPAPFAFEIWKLVNGWTSVWILYSATHIFGTSVPDVLPAFFFVSFTLATIANIAWTQFMSWEIIPPTTGFAFAMMIFLYAALLCSYAGLHKQRYHIRKLDFWIIQLLVNNGIAVYATWATITAFRHFALSMIYFHGVDRELAVTVALGVIALAMIIWFILENTLWKQHLLYTVTIYPVLIWAFTASVIMNLNHVSHTNTVIMQALLTMSGTFFIGKICHLTWNVVQKRKHTRSSDDIEMSQIPRAQTKKDKQKYTPKREGHQGFGQ